MRACSTGSEHSKLLHIGVLHVRFACYMGGICAMRDPNLYIPSTKEATLGWRQPTVASLQSTIDTEKELLRTAILGR